MSQIEVYSDGIASLVLDSSQHKKYIIDSQKYPVREIIGTKIYPHKKFTYRGHRCFITKDSNHCYSVEIKVGRNNVGSKVLKEMATMIDAHGDMLYIGKRTFAFNFAHKNDYIPSKPSSSQQFNKYWNMRDVVKETKRVVDVIVETIDYVLEDEWEEVEV